MPLALHGPPDISLELMAKALRPSRSPLMISERASSSFDMEEAIYDSVMRRSTVGAPGALTRWL